MTDYIVLAILAVTIGALIGAAWVCHDVCKCCPDCHHKLMELDRQEAL